jgi:hypothetical protein
MLKKLFKLFEKPEIRFIEIEAPRPTALSKDLHESLGTLAGHPAFNYLVAKLKVQRSLLETKLKNDRHATLKDVEFLQSGIYWSRWLEDQIQTAVHKAPQASTSTALTEEELSAFNEIRSNTVLIGE